MSSLAVKFDDHAIGVSFTQTSLHFALADGREISAPLEWFPKLRDASDIYPKHLKMRDSNFGFCILRRLPHLAIELAITRFGSLLKIQNPLL